MDNLSWCRQESFDNCSLILAIRFTMWFVNLNGGVYTDMLIVLTGSTAVESKLNHVRAQFTTLNCIAKSHYLAVTK